LREKSGVQRRYITLLTALLIAVLSVSGVAFADSPTFSIDNSLEREEEYFPAGWVTTDTFEQKYTLEWAEEYSSRLKLDMKLEIESEDIIRSQDVDNKTLKPSFEFSIANLIVEFDFSVEDTIEYTNEFNTPRRDNIEFSAELEITPVFKLPALDSQLQRVIDQQGNLVDTVEDKFELTTSYEFGDAFDIDLSWKEEDVDDRIFDNSDIDSHEWEFEFDYSQTYTPALKVDFNTDWLGGREDTLNNAGLILTTEYTQEIENKLKFTLDTHPGVNSDLEFIIKDDLALNGDDDTVDLSLEVTQEVLSLGTMSEALTYNRNRITNPSDDKLTSEVGMELELAGAPWQYLDYAVTLALDTTDEDNYFVPGSSTDTVERSFEISATVTPNPLLVVDNSFTWEKASQDGVDSQSSRNLKIEATFEGELLDVPNLTFEPSVEIVSENDINQGEKSNSQTVELDFTYTWVLPENLSWELSPTYIWKREEGAVERSLEYEDDFTLNFVTPTWIFAFEKNSSFSVVLSDNESVAWQHVLIFAAEHELTPNIVFDTEYEYKFDGEDSNTDKLEANLEWAYRDTTLTFKFINDRTFEGIQNVLRTIEAEFQIEF
jgi:hypothetical protein